MHNFVIKYLIKKRFLYLINNVLFLLYFYKIKFNSKLNSIKIKKNLIFKPLNKISILFIFFYNVNINFYFFKRYVGKLKHLNLDFNSFYYNLYKSQNFIILKNFNHVFFNNKIIKKSKEDLKNIKYYFNYFTPFFTMFKSKKSKVFKFNKKSNFLNFLNFNIIPSFIKNLKTLNYIEILNYKKVFLFKQNNVIEIKKINYFFKTRFYKLFIYQKNYFKKRNLISVKINLNELSINTTFFDMNRFKKIEYYYFNKIKNNFIFLKKYFFLNISIKCLDLKLYFKSELKNKFKNNSKNKFISNLMLNKKYEINFKRYKKHALKTFLILNDFFNFTDINNTNKFVFYPYNIISNKFLLNNLSLINNNIFLNNTLKQVDKKKNKWYNNIIFNNYYPVFLVSEHSEKRLLSKFKINFDIKYLNYFQQAGLNFLEYFFRKNFFLKTTNNFFKKYPSETFLFKIYDDYKNFKPKYLKNCLLTDFFELLWYSFFLKDLNFLSSWISKAMESMNFKNHKKFLQFFQNLLKKYSQFFLSILKIEGFFFDIRGKVGVAGNSKKRHLMFKIGKINKSNKSKKIAFNQNLVRTYSGVLGLTYILNY